jgi:translation initiation factor IF-3
MAQHQNNHKMRSINEDILNNAIRAREVIVILEDGTKIGPISKFDALKMAQERGLDLLQVAVQPDKTAVVKLLDYGKYKYQKTKKAKESKKNQTETLNKEIRLTVGIGEHDLDTKARKAREFLLAGNRVKVSLKFKGREITYLANGQNTLDRFFAKVEDIAKIEKPAKLNTRFLDMYIVPKKN